MNREKLEEKLREYHQEHLLLYYDKLDDKGKEALSAQIEKVDLNIAALIHKDNGLAGKGIVEPLSGMERKEINARRDEFEAAGIQAIQEKKVGAVLLAGGQGSRLGCEGPKGKVNIGITRTLYIFEQLFQNALQVVEKTGAWVPFYIMTSDKTHEETIEFLKENQYFGYQEDYITFFMQEMTPSVDYEGKLLMEAPDRLSLSPNGNGGWFSSMVKAGLLEDVQSRGIEWLNVFAVDNVLQRIADPVFVGATILTGKDSGAKVVKKAEPGERVGVLCKKDGKPSIVEYYEMTPEMLHEKTPEGELSYSYGVILNYLFKLDKLIHILNTNLPIHVAEKKIPYVTPDGEYIQPSEPNGYKFEELVLDMIPLFEDCLPFEVVREEEFAPIKNATGADSPDTARALLKLNGVIL
ncbi:UTP--glucose-1-phosphate uridylyltransferase [Anaerocolumna chitinilytica]|uniref:UDP-N-acetylhexosamine pyrophosphorylase n=1 Tax=Anaerocolumna chitinilytica TaxID=1727145 RepID=A0A7M3S9N4_9FIRM|nr:UDPGP type 1 family protein [Anaerocolumna chitinilytica]BCK01302.1 UDP-N-acetylhexosamine pyrophosphorylase [Anaerocolumna chitinilytica]